MSISLAQINALSPVDFVHRLGPLFEHSPWIAERTAAQCPFATVAALHDALAATLDAATEAEKAALIRAHPDLAGKLAIAGRLTMDSAFEQKSARLDQLTPEQFAHISALNERYQAKFGFPFVICVKDHTQASIFAEFARRVDLAPAAETSAALENIKRIGWHRLQAMLTGP